VAACHNATLAAEPPEARRPKGRHPGVDRCLIDQRERKREAARSVTSRASELAASYKRPQKTEGASAPSDLEPNVTVKVVLEEPRTTWS
jgi:hypothetical protein